jgi:hypothetical protein
MHMLALFKGTEKNHEILEDPADLKREPSSARQERYRLSRSAKF